MRIFNVFHTFADNCKPNLNDTIFISPTPILLGPLLSTHSTFRAAKLLSINHSSTSPFII